MPLPWMYSFFFKLVLKLYPFFTLSFGTPYLLTILVIKLKKSILLPLDVSAILLYVWQTV